MSCPQAGRGRRHQGPDREQPGHGGDRQRHRRAPEPGQPEEQPFEHRERGREGRRGHQPHEAVRPGAGGDPPAGRPEGERRGDEHGVPGHRLDG